MAYKLYVPKVDANGYYSAATTYTDDDGKQWEWVPELPGSTTTQPQPVKHERSFQRAWLQQAIEARRLHIEHPDLAPYPAAEILWVLLDAAKQRPPSIGRLQELVTLVVRFTDNPLPTRRGKNNPTPTLPVQGKAAWLQRGLEAYKLRLEFPGLGEAKITEKLQNLLLINDLILPSPSQLRRMVTQVFFFADNPLAAQTGEGGV